MCEGSQQTLPALYYPLPLELPVIKVMIRQYQGRRPAQRCLIHSAIAGLPVLWQTLGLQRTLALQFRLQHNSWAMSATAHSS